MGSSFAIAARGAAPEGHRVVDDETKGTGVIGPKVHDHVVAHAEAESSSCEPRVCVLIPVFDHADSIGDVVAGVRAHGLPVILVDDGSSRACADALDAQARGDTHVELIRLPDNAGKGAAVIAGARRALACGFSHGFQIDADGQHDLDAIPEAIERTRGAPTAVVGGSPIFDASIPAARLYGRYVTYALVWLNTWSLAIRDPLCGFRVYPLAETVALANRQRIRPRMDFDIDVIVRLAWDAVPIDSVPVAVRYPIDGISHFNLRRDNLLIARLHVVLFFGMLIRAPLLATRRLAALVRAARGLVASAR